MRYTNVMESFQEILMAGGHTNSLGRAQEVFKVVQHDNSKMGELFNCIRAKDAWVRMRAIDTFEKLVKSDPGLAQPYLPLILTDLTKSNQPSIQWHLAQIFAEVELSKHQQVDAVTWLKRKIVNADVDWIVSVNVMKSLLYFHKTRLISREDLMSLFEIQTKHASKSVRKKGRDIYKRITDK